MAAARHNPAGQQWRSFPRETDDPLRIGTDVRSAETRLRHADDDLFGERHPLGEILVKVPVLGAQPVVGVAVKLRFISNLKKKQPLAQPPGNISRLLGILRGRARPKIQAINRVPARRLQKACQMIHGRVGYTGARQLCRRRHRPGLRAALRRPARSP